MSTWKIAADSRSLFCPQCSSILALPDVNNRVECGDCDYIVDNASAVASNPQVQVKFYKQQVQLDDIHADPTTRRATVDEPCPNCNFHQMTFFQMQMRSVDEAATVFFECSECGYTYKQSE